MTNVRNFFVDVQSDIYPIMLQGQIEEGRHQLQKEEAKMFSIAEVIRSVHADVPEPLHKYLDMHEETYNPGDSEHVVSIRVPGLCEVRAAYVRESSDSATWVLLPWSSQHRERRWAVLPSDGAMKHTWEYTATVAHAMYAALRVFTNRQEVANAREFAAEAKKDIDGVRKSLDELGRVASAQLPSGWQVSCERADLAAIRREAAPATIPTPPESVSIPMQFVMRQFSELERIGQALQVLTGTVKRMDGVLSGLMEKVSPEVVVSGPGVDLSAFLNANGASGVSCTPCVPSVADASEAA